MFNVDDIAFRIGNSVQNFSVAVALLAIADQAYLEWRQRSIELNRDNARLSSLILAESNKAEADHQRLIDTVTGQLHRFIREVDKVSTSEAVNSLRLGIAEIVRPLSQAMQELDYSETTIPVTESKLSWRQVLRGVNEVRPMEPVIQPAIVFFVALPYVLMKFGFGLAFEVVTVGMTTSIFVFGVATLTQDYFRFRWQFTWLYSILVSLIAAVLQALVIDMVIPHQVTIMQIMILLCTFTPTIGAVIMVSKSLFHQTQVVEDKLVEIREKLTWALARETEIQRQRGRSLAMALHGPVQSAVGAGIIRLEKAAVEGEVPRQLVSEVTSLIADSIGELDRANQQICLRQVIEDLASTWQGICRVKLDSKVKTLTVIERDQISSALLAEIIPELTFNAIKHGGATDVKVRLQQPKGDVVVLTIEDNGQKYVETNRKGIGLRFLEESALSVRRTFDKTQNVTEVTLPYHRDGSV